MKIFIQTYEDETIETTTDLELADRIEGVLLSMLEDGSKKDKRWMDVLVGHNFTRLSPDERIRVLENWYGYLDERPVRISRVHDRKKIVREEHIKRALERIGGDKDVIVEFGYYDEDNGQVQSNHRTTLSTMLEEIYDADRGWKRGRYSRSYARSCLLDMKTPDDVFMSYGDNECMGDVCVGFIGTVERHEKIEADRRRRELEGLASEIASKHKVTVGALEFLAALDEELSEANYASEEWNNPEVRSEEWMSVRYNGLSSDVYYDDLNFVNGRIGSRLNDLREIRQWCAQNTPLLFAQYEEQCLKEKADETE